MWSWNAAQAAAVATSLHISKKSRFGERHCGAASDDEMVEDLDVHERERALERIGEYLVGLAGLGDAGRVIMRKDHRGGVVPERAFHDLAGIDARLGERALEEH